MVHQLVQWFLGVGIGPEIVTAIVALLPIAELRLAIPVGVALGLPVQSALLWSLLGNILPVIPMLLFLDPVSTWLRRLPFWSRFFDWFFERTSRRAEVVQRYEAVGLAIFVAIPLPLTGAWSGCVAASLFKIPFHLALPAIAAGIVGAGLIVTALVYTGRLIF